MRSVVVVLFWSQPGKGKLLDNFSIKHTSDSDDKIIFIIDLMFYYHTSETLRI